MKRLIEYIKGTNTELKHVSWPTRRQAIAFTIIVILVSVSISLFLGLFDFLFSRALEFFI